MRFRPTAAPSPPESPSHKHTSTQHFPPPRQSTHGRFKRYCVAAAAFGAITGLLFATLYVRFAREKPIENAAERSGVSVWNRYEDAYESEGDGGVGDGIRVNDGVSRLHEFVVKEPVRPREAPAKMCSEMELSRVVEGVGVEMVGGGGEGMASAEECKARCLQTDTCRVFTYDMLRSTCSLYIAAESGKVLVIDQGKAWSVSGICSASRQQTDPQHAEGIRMNFYPRDASWVLQWTARRVFHLEYRYKSYTGHWKERKDYKVQVRRALESLNMSEAKGNVRAASGTNWDLLWGLQWKSLNDFRKAKLRTDQMINMLPGAARLVVGDKDAFHKTFEKMREKFGESAVNQFVLRSFYVDGKTAPNLAEWDKFSGKATDTWVVKEFRSWNGAGVSASYVFYEINTTSQVKVVTAKDVRSMVEAVVPSRRGKDGFIVQQYILNPLTIRGHKFDARWWALVTSVDPLRAYIVPDAYLKIAKSSTYDPGHNYLSNNCMHITNNRAQAKCDTQVRHQQPFPASILDDSLPSQLGDSLGKLLKGFFPISMLVNRTKQVILRSLVMVAPELLAYKIRATEARTFQLFAYDIIYDDINANPWIVEINTNGYLGGGIGAVNTSRDYLRDMFQLVGVTGYNRWKYASRIEQSFYRGFNGNGLSIEEKLVVQDTVDEFVHRGHWDVLFPPMTRAELKPYESLMTPEDIAQAELQISSRRVYLEGLT